MTGERAKRELDMLHGSLWDKILIFALPLAATGILQQLFNAADVAVVGQFVSKDAMAAVGSNTPIISLLVNMFLGISLGTNVVIANAIGSKDVDVVRKTVHTSVLVAILSGVFVGILGELVAEPILNVMSVPAEVFDMSLLYLRIYMLGMPVILLYNFEAAIYRSMGNTRTPLMTLVISGIVNVALNVFFVVVLKRTVDGVALATVISNLVSAVILFAGLQHAEERAVRIEFSSLRIDRRVLQRMLVIGIPSGVQSMTFSLANLVIQAAINSLGSVVMAGSSAAFNLEVFVYYILGAFGQACTTFVGQNHGAGQNDRCKRVLRACVLEDIVFTFAAILIVLVFGKRLLWLFNRDEAVIAAGYMRLLFIFSAYFFSLLQEVFSGYLRGFGQSMLPALVSVIGICGVRLVWIYTVFRRVHTFPAIMISYPISLAVTAAIIVLCTLLRRSPT